MEKRIDLHIHTTCSDGVLSPKQVIDEAKKNHVEIISIADHDTIDAYTDEVFEYAQEKNIKLIPAVEISTKTPKCGIHVLGYNIDLKNRDLIDKLYALRNARHIYLYKVSEKLQKLGYLVNTEELDKIDAVTKAHIALDVIQNKQNEDLLLKNFQHIPSMGEFIETIMNENCPAYVKKESITPKEAAEIIRQADGKVVLAHPVAYTYEDHLTDNDILSLIDDMHADGIEAIYIYIDKNNKKRNACVHWKEFARRYHLQITIGSDFHNMDGIHPVIGLLNENIEVQDEEINTIACTLLDKN